MPRIHSVAAYADLQDHAAFHLDRYGRTVTMAGLYTSLVMIYSSFGGMKFTADEADGLAGLVGNSPLLSWAYSLFSMRINTPPLHRDRRWLLQLLLRVEARLDRRASRRALYNMDDRALGDLGLSSADVERINGESLSL